MVLDSDFLIGSLTAQIQHTLGSDPSTKELVLFLKSILESVRLHLGEERNLCKQLANCLF